MITQAEAKELVSYDPETGIFSWKVIRRGRRPRQIGDRAGSPYTAGYRGIRLGRRNYYEHRVAWLYVHGEWPKEIDHINGNRADNRLVNLRSCEHWQNQCNRPAPPSETGVRGVRRTSKRTWQVRVWHKRKPLYFGSFRSLEAAKAARDAAVIAIQGEYAGGARDGV